MAAAFIPGDRVQVSLFPLPRWTGEVVEIDGDAVVVNIRTHILGIVWIDADVAFYPNELVPAR